MANHSLSTDVEGIGGNLQWQMELDERQLSSDLEQILRLQTASERENDASIGRLEPKQETRSECMFASSSDSVRGETVHGGASGFIQRNDYQNSPGSVWTHPTSKEVPWNQPQQPGSWRHDSSLPSSDLEMDRDASMASFPQLLSPGSSVPRYDASKITVLDTPLTEISRYPHEDRLMRYEGLTPYDYTNHQMWQQNIQQGSMPPTATSQDVTDDSMDDEDVTYSVEVDEYGEGPLHTLSVMKDKLSLAKNIDVLMRCGVVLSCINLQNKQKQTPLFLAVMEGNVGFVAWLLANGANPNIQGTLYVDRYEYIWRSPLHLAAMKGDEWIGILRVLLKKHDLVDINRCSHGDKLSALHLALKHHSPSLSCRQIILELLKYDADITIRDQSNSKTPLMLALETRDLKLVEDFINSFSAGRRRVMLQEQTRSGDTCLHIAAGLSRVSKQDKLKLLRLLVINGANGNIANNARELPRDLAREEWDCIRRT